MTDAAGRRLTLVLACLVALMLGLSIPSALRDTWARGGFYLFSQAFLDDLPRRLTGPGRMRFLLQPLMASLIGIAAGRADRQAGRAPFLRALALHGGQRAALARDAARDIVNLLLAGILLDGIAQWLILGAVYPGPALVVGPVLVSLPYAVARALSCRFGGHRSSVPEGSPR